jgi:hypothetical protein
MTHTGVSLGGGGYGHYGIPSAGVTNTGGGGGGSSNNPGAAGGTGLLVVRYAA